MYKEEFKSKDRIEIYNNIENKSGNEYNLNDEKSSNNDQISNGLPNWASSNQKKQNSLTLNDSLKISQNIKDVQSGEF